MHPPLTVADWRELARRHLPRFVFDYVDGGAEDETALGRNRHAFDAVCLRPRALTDVSRRSQRIDLFGQSIASPLLVAPTGLNGLVHPDGDLALARAARAAEVPFVLSSASTSPVEDVARAGGRLWLQLYVLATRSLAERLMQRARDNGFEALVLTVDVPVSGARERDARNGFAMPFRLTPRLALDAARHPAWAIARLLAPAPELVNLRADGAGDIAAQAALLRREMDTSLDWTTIDWIRAHWPRKLLIKGLLRGSDAETALARGVDGVIVSNHGGRQLDAAPAPLEVLPEIVAAVAGRATVLVDGGFRRGLDVLKARALGADAVLLGRAMLYGLAARGEEGAASVLRLLREEIDRNLALLGCPDIRQLGGADLWRAAPPL